MMKWNWWFNTKKELPDFWKNYLYLFNKKAEKKERFVVFDCESTGLDYKKDRVLSIGAIAITESKIVVQENLELFVQQDLFKPESVLIHGMVKDGKESKIPEKEAIIQFLNFIENATLVGHHVAFDIQLINQVLKRLHLGKLKNKSLDTDAMYQKWKQIPREQHFSLDELCTIFQIKKSDRHTAIGDTYITALLFLKLKSKLEIMP